MARIRTGVSASPRNRYRCPGPLNDAWPDRPYPLTDRLRLPLPAKGLEHVTSIPDPAVRRLPTEQLGAPAAPLRQMRAAGSGSDDS